MDILIYCHGESAGDVKGIIEGRGEYPLTEKGRSDALEFSDYLKGKYRVTAVFTSPLKRALEASETAGKRFGITPEVLEDMTELSQGHLTGLEFVSARERYPYVKNVPYHSSLYGQESRLSFRMRAEAVLSELLSRGRDEDSFLLISHSSFAGQFLKAFMGLPVDSQYFAAFLKNSFSHLSVHGSEVRVIIKINSIEHTL